MLVSFKIQKAFFNFKFFYKVSKSEKKKENKIKVKHLTPSRYVKGNKVFYPSIMIVIIALCFLLKK